MIMIVSMKSLMKWMRKIILRQIRHNMGIVNGRQVNVLKWQVDLPYIVIRIYLSSIRRLCEIQDIHLLIRWHHVEFRRLAETVSAEDVWIISNEMYGLIFIMWLHNAHVCIEFNIAQFLCWLRHQPVSLTIWCIYSYRSLQWSNGHTN